MSIDVHAHYVPPRAIERLERDGARFGIDVLTHEPSCQKCLRFEYGLQLRPFFPKLRQPAEQRIEWMQGLGLTRQILSAWADVFGYGLSVDKGEQWHRLLNDSMAELCARHPGSFSWLASGALPHADRAARELERAVKTLGAVGAVLATNVDGTNLGEVALDEFWATAVALDVPVFLHPTQPVPTPRSAKYSMSQVVQYTFDSTLCFGSLVGSGVFDRFPKLRLILSHGGGAVPFLIGRFDTLHGRADRTASHNVAAEPPSAYLKRVWVDTILHHPQVLRFVAEMVGVDRLVVGTDESFPPHEADPIGMLVCAGFTPGEIELIGQRTPRALFRLPNESL
jgi:aminocarboxymuconate-semialdehyde decarboxylase